MDREAFVYVDLYGVPHLVGRLWSRARKGRETATFEYDTRWLDNAAQFSRGCHKRGHDHGRQFDTGLP